jgi:hypothetical protein
MFILDVLQLGMYAIIQPERYLVGFVLFIIGVILSWYFSCKTAYEFCKLEDKNKLLAFIPLSYIYLISITIPQGKLFKSEIPKWKMAGKAVFAVCLLMFCTVGYASLNLFYMIMVKFTFYCVFLEEYGRCNVLEGMKCAIFPWYAYCMILDLDERLDEHSVLKRIYELTNVLFGKHIKFRNEHGEGLSD